MNKILNENYSIIIIQVSDRDETPKIDQSEVESIEVSEADNKESDSVINDIDNLLAEFDNDRAITPVPECEQKSEKYVTPDVKNDIESDLNSELNNSSILDDEDAMGLLGDTADQIENNLEGTETLVSNSGFSLVLIKRLKRQKRKCS